MNPRHTVQATVSFDNFSTQLRHTGLRGVGCHMRVDEGGEAHTPVDRVNRRHILVMPLPQHRAVGLVSPHTQAKHLLALVLQEGDVVTRRVRPATTVETEYPIVLRKAHGVAVDKMRGGASEAVSHTFA